MEVKVFLKLVAIETIVAAKLFISCNLDIVSFIPFDKMAAKLYLSFGCYLFQIHSLFEPLKIIMFMLFAKC